MTAKELARWSELQQQDPTRASPFFRPEFAQLAGRQFESSRVAVWHDDGEPVAFFPFQTDGARHGAPIGDVYCDFQGLVAARGFELTDDDLVADCDLRSFRFHHFVEDSPLFRGHDFRTWESPYIDLEGGFEIYRDERKRAGSGALAYAAQRQRKLEREVGPVRVELNCTEESVFRRLIEWKSDQYVARGAPNYVAAPEARRFLESVWREGLARRFSDYDVTTQPSDSRLGAGRSHEQQSQVQRSYEQRTDRRLFDGPLAALYAGSTLVAVHLGLRSGRVLHYWFPAYNTEFATYSPGMLLLVRLLETAQSEGIARVDLGRGDEAYKLRLMNGVATVREGAYDTGVVRSTLRRGWYATRRMISASPLGNPARTLVRGMRRWWHQLRDSGRAGRVGSTAERATVERTAVERTIAAAAIAESSPAAALPLSERTAGHVATR
ncbi:MAG TPA: GNAT family N-acetyltransferase [Pirellulaceae bacterium]|nr:GNAT family N-acetyltransferase [Pirellulaceae bacterium]